MRMRPITQNFALGLARGQAIVESAVVIALSGLLLIAFVPTLHAALQQRYDQAQHLQVQLQQTPLRTAFDLPPLDPDWLTKRSGKEFGEGHTQILVSDHYPTAAGLRPLWSLLAMQRGFSLPIDNLYTASWSVTDAAKPTLVFSALSDDWSPHTVAGLQTRVQALTPTQTLHALGFENVQQLLGWLPFTREFGPDNLRLGHVDIDAVPMQHLCVEALCP